VDTSCQIGTVRATENLAVQAVYILMTYTLLAQHTTTGSANSGMDMTMPGSDFSDGGKTNVFWGPQLQSAINNRQVQQSRLDDMVKRVLAAWYLLGQDKG
jgi:hypothetical protein